MIRELVDWVDDAVVGEGDLSDLVLRVVEVNRPFGVGVDEKAVRRWHIRLNQLVTREKRENVLVLVGRLSCATLGQIGGLLLGDSLGLYVDSVSRLLQQLGTDVGLVDAGKLLREVVRAWVDVPVGPGKSETNKLLGKLVVQFAKVFRGLCESGSGSLLLLDYMKILDDLIDISPSLVRGAVGQIEAGSVCLLLGGSKSLQGGAAGLLARTPCCYGNTTGVAWKALVGACLRAANRLLGVTEEDEDENGDYYGKLKNLSVKSNVSTNEEMNSVGPAFVFQGICRCLMSALGSANGKAYLSFRLDPFIELFKRGLACDSKSTQKVSFPITSRATVSLLGAFIPVVGLKLCRYGTVVSRLLGRLMALGVDNYDSQACLMECVASLVLTFRSSTNPEFANTCLRHAQELILSLDNVKTSQAKGGKRRRVAIVQKLPEATKQKGLVAVRMALRVVSLLLATCGPRFDSALREDLDATLLKLLQPILQGHSFILDDASLCAHVDLRIALLKCLLASVLAPVGHNGTSFALPIAIKIFKFSQNDHNHEVAEWAIHACAATQASIHPVSPVIGEPKRMQVAQDIEEPPRKKQFTGNVVLEEQPKVVLEEQPKVVLEKQPKVVLEEQPKVVLGKQPKVVLEEQPKVALEQPKVLTPVIEKEMDESDNDMAAVNSDSDSDAELPAIVDDN